MAASREQYGDPARFPKPLPQGVKQVLYDLEADPLQMHPVYPGQGKDEVVGELHTRLASWLDSLGDPFLERDWH